MSKSNNSNSNKQSSEQMITQAEDPMLTLSEVAEMVGKSRQTISRWVKDGLLKPIRDPSGLSRIRQSTLETFYSSTALAEVQADKAERAQKAAEEARKRQEAEDQAKAERLAELEAERRLLTGEATREDIQARRLKQLEG